MNNDELIKRIQAGDKEAFKTIYAAYGRDVYLRARKELGSDTAAKGVVKQTFLNLQREILRAGAPTDLAVRINELSEKELQLLRILAGESAEAVFEQTAQKAAEAGAQSEAPAAQTQTETELPPLERARGYMAAEETGKGKRKKRVKAEAGAEKHGAGAVAFSALLLTVFLLLLVWVGEGILMDFDILPSIDLGYGWFNAHIFPLFAA